MSVISKRPVGLSARAWIKSGRGCGHRGLRRESRERGRKGCECLISAGVVRGSDGRLQRAALRVVFLKRKVVFVELPTARELFLTLRLRHSGFNLCLKLELRWCDDGYSDIRAPW